MGTTSVPKTSLWYYASPVGVCLQSAWSQRFIHSCRGQIYANYWTLTTATWVWLTQSHKDIMPSPCGSSSSFLAMTSPVLFLRLLHLAATCQFFYRAIWRHHSTFRLPTCSSAFQRAVFLQDPLPEFVLELLSIILTTCPAQCDLLKCVYKTDVFTQSVHYFVVPQTPDDINFYLSKHSPNDFSLKETDHLCGTLGSDRVWGYHRGYISWLPFHMSPAVANMETVDDRKSSLAP